MPIAAKPEATLKSPKPWLSAKRLLLILSFFGLASLNVLTLVSEQVHTAGYSVMKAILARAVPEAEASRLLSQSPTVRRQHDVAAATQVLLQEKSARAAVVLKTSNRIAVRSLKNTTRNVFSVFAKAIPGLGTGTILALTAWDVYDVCETLKDINELNSVFDHPPEDQTKVCGMKVPTPKQVLTQIKTNAKAVDQSAAEVLKKENVEISP